MKIGRWPKLALLSVLGVSAVLAATYVVQKDAIDVKAGKGSMYTVVGQLKKGETAQVVREEPGGWLVVKVGDKEGYVKATAFDAPRGRLVAESSAGQTDPAAAAAAARGIGPVVQTYAREKNLRPDPLIQMIDNRRRVEGPKWNGFANEGHVGPYKK